MVADATLVLPQRTPAVPSLPEAVEAGFARYGVHASQVRVTETIQAGIPLIQSGTAWGILPNPSSRSDATIQRLLATARGCID